MGYGTASRRTACVGRGLLLGALAALLGASAATAAPTYTWTGAASALTTNWSQPLNWQGAQTPSGNPAGNVLFDTANSGGATQADTVDMPVTVTSLQLNGGDWSIGHAADSAITIADQGAVEVSAGMSTEVDAPLDVAGAATLQVASGANLKLASDVSGGGGLTKAGPGIATLSGSNSYSGGTSVLGGLLDFSSLSSLGSGNVTLDGGGLQWSPGTSTDVSPRLNPLGERGATLDTNGNDLTLGSDLSGPGGVTKSGAGTLSLAGANTYLGQTDVQAGGLQVDGSIESPATVEKDATLTVTGTVDGPVTVQPGGSLSCDGGTLNGGLTNHGTATGVPGRPTDVSAVAHNSEATVSFTPGAANCSPIDAYTVTAWPSGQQTSGSGSPITIGDLTDGASYTFTVTATNPIGTGPVSSASNQVTPAGPPSVSLEAPEDGAAYSQGDVVDASYSCSAGSGTTLQSCVGSEPSGSPIDTSNPGQYDFTVTATDADGQTTVATSTYTVAAPGPPWVSIAAPEDGATYSQGEVVDASYSCAADSGTTLQSCVGSEPSGSPIDTSNPGQYDFTVTATDADGQTTVATDTYTVTRRSGGSPPVVGRPTAMITSPSSGAWFTQSQVVEAQYSCRDAMGGPGIESCTGTVPNGGPIDTSRVGRHYFSVQAKSRDGQTAVASSGYTVLARGPGPGKPSAVIAVPANGASFTQGQAVTASLRCYPGAWGGVLKAGLDGCSATAANGAPVDTSTTGTHTFWVRATDTDGQTTTVTSTYTVNPPPIMAPIESGHATVTGARAVIRLGCGTTGRCIGNLEVYVVAKPAGSRHKRRLVVATGRFSMRAGQTMSVSVPLTPNGKALLRQHHGTLHTTLALVPTGGTPTSTPLTLKRSRDKHHAAHAGAT